MHTVLRADGSPTIGYGHLIRSSALAEELLARNQTVTVATTTPQPARGVFPTTVDIIDLPVRGDPQPFIKWLDTVSADIVFTDAYPVDTTYQRLVRDRVPLVVLQDDNRHSICADLFINGNLYACDLDYEFVGKTPEKCLGADYVLLRHEIRNRIAKRPLWREQPERALVLMGGSDVAELTPSVVRSFDDFDLHVDAIVGPGCSTTQEQNVRCAASDSSADIRVSRDPDDLVDWMAQADFAVSTASSTTYELLALKTPIICTPVVPNQEPIAEALREHDAAIVLKYDDEKMDFSSAIQSYMINSSLRRQHRNTGIELIDGQGTVRVAKKILDYIKY